MHAFTAWGSKVSSLSRIYLYSSFFDCFTKCGTDIKSVVDIDDCKYWQCLSVTSLTVMTVLIIVLIIVALFYQLFREMNSASGC
jgi:hypothetical protein